jgi:hypothetical protein
MKQRPALNNLLESMRLMAARYRTWAEEHSGDRAAEYARLAIKVDRTISELERHTQRHSRD